MSFSNLFRMIFVLFFLYLLGDAFYRWDGFEYYASFWEFLPSIALISVIMFIIVLLTTTVIWSFLFIIYKACIALKFNIGSEHILLNVSFMVLTGSAAIAVKKLMLTDVHTTQLEKIMVIAAVMGLSVILAWLLRNYAQVWINSILDHITPLVWLFGIIVTLSIPLVTFYAFGEPAVEITSTIVPDRLEYKSNRPNIILVTYDALTARDMSLYGYYRDTTPFISEWAKSATVFNRCEAASNTTSQTTASLVTGKRVWTHRKYQSDAGHISRIDKESVPLLLKNNGYFNMAFITNDLASVKRLGMSNSFHVMPSPSSMIEPASVTGFLHKYLVKYFDSKIKLYDWILKPDFILAIVLHQDFLRYPSKNQFPVEKAFDMLLEKINDNDQMPYFAWIHLYPPHAPYLPPKPYIGMFEPSPKYRTAKSQYPLINPRYYNKNQQGDADIVRGRYDEFIRYCDNQFQYFIGQLSNMGKLENTVIILSSDHGESFEHGYFTHGSHFLYEAMTHIPLIIKGPAQDEGRVIDFPVEQTDISATILDLAGISVPFWMDGRSLGPVLRGEEFQPAPVFSMNLEAVHMLGQDEISKGVFAVWQGDHKLIYYPTTETFMLFNLKLDPDEKDNIIDSDWEHKQYLVDLIQDNIRKVNERLKDKSLYRDVQ